MEAPLIWRTLIILKLMYTYKRSIPSLLRLSVPPWQSRELKKVSVFLEASCWQQQPGTERGHSWWSCRTKWRFCFINKPSNFWRLQCTPGKNPSSSNSQIQKWTASLENFSWRPRRPPGFWRKFHRNLFPPWMNYYWSLQLAMSPDLNGDLVYSNKSELYGAYFVVTGGLIHSPIS